MIVNSKNTSFSLLLFLIACTPPQPSLHTKNKTTGQSLNKGGAVLRGVNNYNTDRDYNRDRDRSRDRSSSSRSGECDDKKSKCEEICKDIFSNRHHREDCEELSLSDVEEMEEVVKVLQNPSKSDLEDLNLDALKDLLDISSDPLLKAIKKWKSPSKRERFLAWFARDSSAGEIIIDAEDDFDIRDALFERFWVSPSSRADLNQDIEDRKTFVEIALEEDNQPVLEWLHSSFEQNRWCDQERGNTFRNGDEDRDLYPVCVFHIYYCGLSLSTDAESELFRYDFFTELLDEILIISRPSRRPPSWWTADAESGDLDSFSSPPNDVCRYMWGPAAL